MTLYTIIQAGVDSKMSRNDYDDMPSTFSRKKRGNSSKTVLVSLMGILIILIVFLFYMLFKPIDDSSAEGSIPVQSEMNLDVGEVVRVTVNKPSSAAPKVEDKKEEEPAIQEAAVEPDQEESGFTDYIVERGDTLALIGQKFSVSASSIANVNRIADQTALVEGQRLAIPPIDGQLYQVAEGDDLPSVMKRFDISMSNRDFMKLNNLDSDVLEEGTYLFIPGIVVSEEESMFSRPGEGNVSFAFGEVVNGYKLEGVGFSMAAGSAVKAVADGFVSDAGNNERFGRFVTIIHAGGYKSSYYCLEIVNVKLGQSIKKGEIVGTVGTSTKFFPSSTLYLTLEQGALKLDPMLFL